MKARPTIYNGIQMRSRLEARVAAWLDVERIAWEYEPMAFASPAGQYLPDFRLPDLDPSGRPTYLEVKPTSDEIGQVTRRLDIIRESDRHANLALGVEPWLMMGILPMRIGSLPWQPCYLVRCPCGGLCIGDDHRPWDGRTMVYSTCHSCGDDAYRDPVYCDRLVRLPAWNETPAAPRINLEAVLTAAAR